VGKNNYIKDQKNTIYIFDEESTIGSDIDITEEGIVIITIRKYTTLTDIRQSIYRFRIIYNIKININFYFMYYNNSDIVIITENLNDIIHLLIQNENEKIDTM
jgi:hypothetical protein